MKRRLGGICLIITLLTACSVQENDKSAQKQSSGQTFLRNKESYEYKDYEELLSSGFNGWHFLRDSPSKYTGQRVATIGFFNECYLSGVTLNQPKPRWNASMALLRVDWSKVSTKRVEYEKALCHTSMTRIINSLNGTGISDNDKPDEALYMIYGVVRSSSLGTDEQCRLNVSLCNRIEIEDLVFLDSFRSNKAFFGQLLGSSIEQGGPILMDYLLKKSATQ